MTREELDEAVRDAKAPLARAAEPFRDRYKKLVAELVEGDVSPELEARRRWFIGGELSVKNALRMEDALRFSRRLPPSSRERRDHILGLLGPIENGDDPETAFLKAAAIAKKAWRTDRLGLHDRVDPIAWTVDGILPSGEISVLYGPWGAFKSFFVAALAVSVASGRDFFGAEVEQGPVLVLASEGRVGFIARLHAAVRAWDVEARKKADPFFALDDIDVALEPARLGDPDFAARLALNSDLNSVPALVVVDTWAGNLHGDEDKPGDVHAAIAQLRLVFPSASILLVHHTGHGSQDRPRGSSALMGAVSAAFRMVRGKGGRVLCRCVKMKDAPPPPDRIFQLRPVVLEGMLDASGRPLASAVLEAVEEGTDDAGETEAPSEPRGRNERKALALLRTLAAEAPDVSLADWREACEGAGIPPNRFAEVKAGLQKKDFIETGKGVVRISGPVSENPKPSPHKGREVISDFGNSGAESDPKPNPDDFGQNRIRNKEAEA